MKFLDLDELSDEDKLLKEEVHRFAVEVMRPASIELDRMGPEERVKPDSPYFRVFREMKKLGYHKITIPAEMGGVDLTPLQRYMIMEELGWGSLGLATAIGVDQIPFACAALFGPPELYEELVVPWLEDDKGKYHGCWGVTEPEHGSDYLIALREDEELVRKFGKGNVVAEKDGDEWIISG
ncbi:MAG: acyl-CoA/acyl-ACP dehydrogenase, partial [Archaeoglobi archaeon]|nr:acyl-CoA/acyl-ACP dehydrogenase [Archaeoglobi archaeon]